MCLCCVYICVLGMCLCAVHVSEHMSVCCAYVCVLCLCAVHVSVPVSVCRACIYVLGMCLCLYLCACAVLVDCASDLKHYLDKIPSATHEYGLDGNAQGVSAGDGGTGDTQRMSER